MGTLVSKESYACLLLSSFTLCRQFEKNPGYRPDLFQAICSLTGHRKDNRSIIATTVHAFENDAIGSDAESLKIVIVIRVGCNDWLTVESLESIGCRQVLLDNDVLSVERMWLCALTDNFYQSQRVS